MKITINLTEDEIEHIYPEHVFYDCCEVVKNIMLKVQNQVKDFKNKNKNKK